MSFNKVKPVPEKTEKGLVIMTEKYACEICEYNGYYYQPEFNKTLHLHYKAFHKIENLDKFVNLRTLYLENNCITKIENLSHMKQLCSLYLHNNLIETIENLDENTSLSTVNLSGNRIKEISGLSNLKNLTNLYLEKNNIEEVGAVKLILECPSITVLDIANNYLEKNEDELLSIFSNMPNLKVLYLHGNEITRNIKNYRKLLINTLKNLTYLDNRPVDEGDRLGSEAFFRSGLDEERKVREEYRKSKDTGYKVRKLESEKEQISFQERKQKAMLALKNEYVKKKDYLENKKRKLINDIHQNPAKKMEISKEILAVDYQLKENEKLLLDEERNIIFTMAVREKLNSYSVFEYEDWMDPILINNVVENMFDFPISLKLIQLELKNRNVPNYELFSEFELRTRWTEIELKLFRKGEVNKYTNEEEAFKNQEKFNENLKFLNAEKDKRIIFSNIKETTIDESILENFKPAVSIADNVLSHTQADQNCLEANETKEKYKEDQSCNEAGQDKKNLEKPFRIDIKEETIEFSQLD